LEKITGKKLRVFWFNPRNGNLVKKEPIENKGTQFFQPPESGYGQDWVLVLEDGEKNFPPI